MKYSILKNAFLVWVLILGANPANADHLLACPPAENLKTFLFSFALPYKFNNQSKTMRFVSVAGDPANHMGLVLYPLPVGLSEDPEATMHMMVAKLQQETAAPVNYRLAEGVTLTMCIYSIPGHDNVNAFVVYSDGEDYDGDALRKSNHTNQANPAVNFIKMLNLS